MIKTLEEKNYLMEFVLNECKERDGIIEQRIEETNTRVSRIMEDPPKVTPKKKNKANEIKEEPTPIKRVNVKVVKKFSEPHVEEIPTTQIDLIDENVLEPIDTIILAENKSTSINDNINNNTFYQYGEN